MTKFTTHRASHSTRGQFTRAVGALATVSALMPAVACNESGADGGKDEVGVSDSSPPGGPRPDGAYVSCDYRDQSPLCQSWQYLEPKTEEGSEGLEVQGNVCDANGGQRANDDCPLDKTLLGICEHPRIDSYTPIILRDSHYYDANDRDERSEMDQLLQQEHWCLADGNPFARSARFDPRPKPTKPVSDAIDLAQAGSVACLVREGGEIACWGESGAGALGTGEIALAPRVWPVALDLPPVADVIALMSAFCAVTEDGDVYCWGKNEDGIAGGPPTDEPLLSPTKVEGLPAMRAGLLDGCSGFPVCGIARNGTAWGWGYGSVEQLPNLANVVRLSGNGKYAITDDGTVIAQSADEDADILNAFTGATDLDDFHSLCGVVDGEVLCANEDYTSDTYGEVYTVELPGKAVAIDQSCALLTNDQVWCWERDPSIPAAPHEQPLFGTWYGPKCSLQDGQVECADDSDLWDPALKKDRYLVHDYE